MNNVAVVGHAPEQSTAVAITPLDMLNRAVMQGADIGIMERLMALHERWEAGQARKAFDAAISAAQAECPTILKTAKGHNAKLYADFASITRAIDPVITKHGLAYRFRTRQDDRIHVTCVLSHIAGHTEENTLSGPPDASGSKNAIQAIGSTLTYLQRYSLMQSLGLAASEDDDASHIAAGDVVTDEQAEILRQLAIDARADIPKLLEYFKAESVADIKAARFAEAEKMLLAKKKALNNG